MNVEDEMIKMLDEDPEVTLTVDQAIANIKSAPIASLSAYRTLATQYKGWKPQSMEDYIDRINGSEFRAKQLEMEQQRKADNKRVTRAYRLPVKPKKD